MMAAMSILASPFAARFLTALAMSAAAAAVGFAFAGWIENGDRLLFALIQSGLALCF